MQPSPWSIRWRNITIFDQVILVSSSVQIPLLETWGSDGTGALGLAIRLDNNSSLAEWSYVDKNKCSF